MYLHSSGKHRFKYMADTCGGTYCACGGTAMNLIVVYNLLPDPGAYGGLTMPSMGQRDDLAGPKYITGHNPWLNHTIHEPSNTNLMEILEISKPNHKGRHPPLEPPFIPLPEAHSPAPAHAHSLHPPSAHQGHHVTGGSYLSGLPPAHTGPPEARESPLNLTQSSASERSSHPRSCSGSPINPRESREPQEPTYPSVTQNSDLLRRLQAPLTTSITTVVPIQGTRYVPIKRRAPSDSSTLGSVGTGSPCTSGSGSPSSSDPDTAPPPVKKKSNRGRKPGQLSKGNHLWEFLLDLLNDANYNPGLIKWQNRPEGIFRIVKSHEVAAMWGLKKNRPTMNYEKLSRALRFCKTVGYIKDVPKDGPYPKKLCFSFGDKTTGWQEPSAMPYNNAFRTSAFDPTTAFNGVHIKQEKQPFDASCHSD